MKLKLDPEDAKHKVTFQSWNPYMPYDMAEGAREKPIEAFGYLYMPEGDRPEGGWPGVVVAQGLGGPKPHREVAYGRWLAEQGYAAMVLDSFGSRGIGGPDDWKALRLTTAQMIADSYAALRYMGARPDIDADAIAIKGYSYGGMVAMITAFEPVRRLYLPDGERFGGHVAYYGCSIPRMEQPETSGAPVLIMIGKKDKNVSIPRTEKIAEDLRKGGSEVDLRIYDCYHQWDGNDEEPRRVGFNLRHCHIRVNDRAELFDEDTGRKIDGPFSRFFFLARYASFAGYHIQHDKRIARESNAELLDFLQRMQERAGVKRPIHGRVEGAPGVDGPD